MFNLVANANHIQSVFLNQVPEKDVAFRGTFQLLREKLEIVCHRLITCKFNVKNYKTFTQK